MKLFILLLLFYYAESFNINNMGQIVRRDLINQISKISLLPIISKNSNQIDKSYLLNEIEAVNQDAELELVYSMQNNIYFYSPVTKSSCFELEKTLITLDKDTKTFKEKYDFDRGPINLHIQSKGGSLFHTIYIVDLIKKLDTPVYTYVDGFAASAATLMSVVGKKRYMTENSLLLIHQLSGGASGKYSEIEDEKKNLESLMTFIIKIYKENTKLEENKLVEILNRDIWLNSSFCLKNGLVDEVI